MKIIHKLTLIVASIVLFSLLFVAYAIYSKIEYEKISAEKQKIQKLVIALTDFRASSRQVVVEALQARYLWKGNDFKDFKKAIESKDVKTQNLLNLIKDSSRKDYYEHLATDIETITKRLDFAIKDKNFKSEEERRKEINDCLQTMFFGDFLKEVGAELKYITDLQESFTSQENQLLARFHFIVPISFGSIFLLTLILLLPFMLGLKRRFGSILNSLALLNPDLKKFPKIYDNKSDEIGEITHSYNELSERLNEATQNLERQQLELIKSSKLSSLGEMAGGIAHEINNPLAVILGKANQMRRQLEKGSLDPNFYIENLAKIEAVCQRMSNIVNGLRTFARDGEKDSFTIVKLEAIISETLALCQEKFKLNGVMLKIDISPSLTLECRHIQLSQVFLNLLNNSFYAIKQSKDPWIEVKALEDNGKLNIYFTDSGHGIDKDIADKIMHPFFTTKPIGTGTGLGLSISSGIIKNHGGTLTLNQECSNTQFVVCLPQVQKDKNKAA